MQPLIDASGLRPDRSTFACPICDRRVGQILVTEEGRAGCTHCLADRRPAGGHPARAAPARPLR